MRMLSEFRKCSSCDCDNVVYFTPTNKRKQKDECAYSATLVKLQIRVGSVRDIRAYEDVHEVCVRMVRKVRKVFLAVVEDCRPPSMTKKLFDALYGLVESFFKNDEGHNGTVNGDRYRAMITNFFIPELNNHDVQELWFQQDGATCHTARATIDLLKDTFGNRLISRFGSVNWPPRSCDLIPLDYFLWGYAKSLVYADKPQTLDHLEDNIRRVIADIRSQMLEKVIENWTSRLDYIRGSPMPEIIFKM
ncbi:uncharacterized protein TNCV_1385832 [Trichonephila clavipes]|nr:uncharacterized protein TNCV_1385832 [Trichonephila clavipes]